MSSVFASKTKGSLSLVKSILPDSAYLLVRKAFAGWLCGRGCALASVPVLGLSTSEGVVGLLPSAYDGCW